MNWRAVNTPTQSIVVRLHPGQDVRVELLRLIRDNHVKAGYVAAAIGSLDCAQLRFAAADAGQKLPGPWEVCSLSGTLSVDGIHCHVVLSDGNGRTVGGHLLAGCIVRTTLELVLGVLDDVQFLRKHDDATGFSELSWT